MDFDASAWIALAGLGVGLATVLTSAWTNDRRIKADERMQTERLDHEAKQKRLDREQAERTAQQEVRRHASETYVRAGVMLDTSKPDRLQADFHGLDDAQAFAKVALMSQAFTGVKQDLERLMVTGWTTQVRRQARHLLDGIDFLNRSYFAYATAIANGNDTPEMRVAFEGKLNECQGMREALLDTIESPGGRD